MPFVAAARRKLHEAAAASSTLLSSAAWQALENHLLEQLSEMAGNCLLAELDSFRRQAGFIEQTERVHPSNKHYRAFVLQARAELPAWLGRYAALARGLIESCRLWVTANAEFLERLMKDAPALANAFYGGIDPGPVIALEPGLSDRHHGGRQAMCLHFAGQRKLLYKPKRLHQEAAFAGLLRFLEESGEIAREELPASVQVLPRETYGWAAFVEPSAARTPDDVRWYHRRAGVLLALIHLLGGNDAVMDNLIATSAGPVLIDLETFFQPRAASAATAVRGQEGASLQAAKAVVTDSVLRTGLLPMWQRTARGTLYDISGLAGEGVPDTGRDRAEWRDVNTDAMHITRVPDPRPAQKNLLMFEGRPVRASEYLEEIAAGYARCARALIARRDRLTGPAGLIRALFAGGATRFLLRPSYVYSVLLHGELSAPGAWTSGLERAICMERLLRPFVQRAEPGQPPPALWPLLRYERTALEQGDIPHFPIAVDAGRDLRLVDALSPGATALVIPDLFAESGLELAETRLRGLDEAGIAVQINLLRAAFQRPTDEAALARSIPPESRAELDATPLLPPAALVDCAANLARQLLAQSIPSGNEALTWFSPAGLRLDEQTLQGGNYYLYDGNCGVALFLAACHALGLVDARETVRRACRPVENLLNTGTSARMRGLGICVGVPSAVYAHVRIAGLLQDNGYLEAADRMARAITPEQIAADCTHDLFGGTAGAVLALLALHSATGESRHLESALAGGRHLAARQRPVPAGGAAWPAEDGRVPTGFAHGAAGILYALARLDDAAGHGEFINPISEALTYERALFQPETLNWPMINEPGGDKPHRFSFLNAWCNGAAGIGLSRLALGNAQDEQAQQEIEHAIRKNEIGGLPAIDFLCCGNFGRIAFLHEAALRGGREAAGAEAQRRAALAVRRSEVAGSFSFGLDPADNRCFHPGFFRGVAGIGYQLLRLAHPEAIPAVLLFE